MENTLVWFDLPVTDLKRAIKFYTSVLNVEFQEMEHGPSKMAFFPFEPGVVSGSLIEEPDYTPSDSGTVVYLNGGKDLSVPLGRVEAAGGSIVMEKTDVGENGFIARFKDLDGNIVALHNPN